MADEDRSEEPEELEERDYEAEAKHAAKAGAKVERAAEGRYVRGGPDGPEEIEGILRRGTAPAGEQTWTRGDDPEAAALALATASVGTTGGPFAGSYNHAAQALAGEEPVSEEDRIAGQHRHHAETSKEVPEKEAAAKAHEDAKAKKAAADKATKGSAEGGDKEAKDAPAPTGDAAPPAD